MRGVIQSQKMRQTHPEPGFQVGPAVLRLTADRLLVSKQSKAHAEMAWHPVSGGIGNINEEIDRCPVGFIDF